MSSFKRVVALALVLAAAAAHSEIIDPAWGRMLWRGAGDKLGAESCWYIFFGPPDSTDELIKKASMPVGMKPISYDLLNKVVDYYSYVYLSQGRAFEARYWNFEGDTFWNWITFRSEKKQNELLTQFVASYQASTFVGKVAIVLNDDWDGNAYGQRVTPAAFDTAKSLLYSASTASRSPGWCPPVEKTP